MSNSTYSGFATKHSRDFYKGTSFHYSGEWLVGTHYLCDEYTVDFIVYNNVLLRCKKSHLAYASNKPTDFITDSRGNVIGLSSHYWDFVLAGVAGITPGVKIVDNYWYICNDTGVPVDQQVWVNTGVKAKFEFSDLTPEEIAELQEPGRQVVQEFIENNIVQIEGDNQTKVMSQAATTTSLAGKADKVQNAVAGNIVVLQADGNILDSGKSLAEFVEHDDITIANQEKIEEILELLEGGGGGSEEIPSIISQLATINETLANKADKSEIPDKTSELTNDAGFITSADVMSILSDITWDCGGAPAQEE